MSSTENINTLFDFHLRNKTPLVRLGNSVKWLEEKAKTQKDRDESSRLSEQADDLRMTISLLYARRDSIGEYAED